MKKSFIISSLFFTTLLICVSCSNDDSFMNEAKEGTESVVTFRPLFPDGGNGSRKAPSKIKETTFESGDVIGVFAVDASTGSNELKSSNYRDNVRYRFNGSSFAAVDEAITISDANTKGLAYYAVYPYISNAGATASFTVKSNQQSHSDYSLSDLCTAYTGPTTSQTVDLTFNHRLSNVIVELQGDNLASKSVSAKATNVQRTVQMGLNANAFVANGNKGEILMNSAYTNAYQCIIAPQDIAKDTQMFVATIDGKEYPYTLPSTSTFKSGCQYTIKLKVEGDKLVAISGSINPWNSDDPGTGGGDEQAEKMESDPALEVYVTAAERIGNNLIIDYTVKNVSGQDLNKLEFTTYGGALDELSHTYSFESAFGAGEYKKANTSAKLRNGNTTECHLKILNYDPTNKAKTVSCDVEIRADDYTFTKSKISFYVDYIMDNRLLVNGIQTCNRNLKFSYTKCKLDSEGNAIVDFTIQNLMSDAITGFKFGTYSSGKDDLNTSCAIYSSLNGSEYSRILENVVIPANGTITGSVKLIKPGEGAKNVSFDIECSSSNLVMEDDCVRFITIPIQ
mgnify:CR=1 FL=1